MKKNHLKLTIIGLLLMAAMTAHAQTVHYVRQSASGSGNGDSWANASDDLQLMINQADPGDEIWVAEGTYVPKYTANGYDAAASYYPNSDGSRFNSFVLKANVKIYGGFPDTDAATSKKQRDWNAYPSILSGNRGVANNNCYHVVIASGDVGTACLNGFTVSDGFANAASSSTVTVNNLTITNNYGGGIFIHYSSPLLENLIVENNRTANTTGSFGGGIYADYASPVIKYTVLKNNRSGYGAGMYNSNAPAILTDVIIEGNQANFGGGGIRNNISSVTLRNVIIRDNTAMNNDGGGVHNTGAAPLFINVLITGNHASGGGGMYNASNCNAILTNVTIAGNVARTTGGLYPNGGGIYNSSSNPKITNSIIWGNLIDGSTVSNIYNYSSNPTYNNCLVGGVTLSGGIILNDNPQFVDAPAGKFQLAKTSPAINKGDNNAYLTVRGLSDFYGETDLAGSPRQIETIDLGAYEYPFITPTKATLIITDIIYGEKPAPTLTGGSNPCDADTVYLYATAADGVYSSVPPVHVGDYWVKGVLKETATCLADTTLSVAFKISPATVSVAWGNTLFTYNGNPQAPSATATGVNGEKITLEVTGEQTNAGSGYTATASFDVPNNNYMLSGTTTTFTIMPIVLNVQWDNNSFTYNGYPQVPMAIATGANGEKLLLSVTGAQTDAGTGYMATASLDVYDSNYTLNGTTTTFRIDPAAIKVHWRNNSFIYNGFPQVPMATATGVNGEGLPLTITGEQTNAGTEYMAKASFDVPNNNYYLVDDVTSFDILPFTLSIRWGETSFIYNGFPQSPIAAATGVNGEDLLVAITGEQINAGTGYTAKATLMVPDNNYTLINPTTPFDISPAIIEITAISETITYGQTPELAYTITSGELIVRDAISGELAVETLRATYLQPPYPVGIHSIVQGTLDAGSNYVILFHQGTLTVLSANTSIFDLLVNDAPATYFESMYHAIAEKGEPQALIQVVTDPNATVAINGIKQNPLTVDLPKYGENYFIITVTAQNGNEQDYLLVIVRYYERVIYEFHDVPAVNCNTETNGGFVFSGFQWYRDDEVILGANLPYYQIKDNAAYHCVLTLDEGVYWRTINLHPISALTSGKLTVYPNPTRGKVTIQQGMSADNSFLKGKTDGSISNESLKKELIQVFDLNGHLVLQPATNPFDMSLLPNGIYLIKMNGETVRVIKTN